MDVIVITFETPSALIFSAGAWAHSGGYAIEPVAMIVPWPASSLGTDAIVPSPPGLVSEMLVPWKSSAVSLFSRVLVIRSS